MGQQVAIVNRHSTVLSFAVLDGWGLPQATSLSPGQTLVVDSLALTPYIRSLADAGHLRIAYAGTAGPLVIPAPIAELVLQALAPVVVVT
jgi:hypothetical protein